METIKEIRTFEVDHICPRCKKGHLRPDGRVLTTNPPQYPHRCTDCEYTTVFNKTFPYIKYDSVGSTDLPPHPEPIVGATEEELKNMVKTLTGE